MPENLMMREEMEFLIAERKVLDLLVDAVDRGTKSKREGQVELLGTGGSGTETTTHTKTGSTKTAAKPDTGTTKTGKKTHIGTNVTNREAVGLQTHTEIEPTTAPRAPTGFSTTTWPKITISSNITTNLRIASAFQLTAGPQKPPDSKAAIKLQTLIIDTSQVKRGTRLHNERHNRSNDKEVGALAQTLRHKLPGMEDCTKLVEELGGFGDMTRWMGMSSTEPWWGDGSYVIN